MVNVTIRAILDFNPLKPKVIIFYENGLLTYFVYYLCFSIGELVQHGKNGFLFETYLELSQQILTWFYDFPNNATLANVKGEFNERLNEFQRLRWRENWIELALPLFRE